MSTIVLILKSLAPFLKEMILKDKGLRDLISANKVASLLSACLITVVVLFIYATDVADNYYNQIQSLTREKTWLEERVTEKQVRITYLEKILFPGLPIPPAPDVIAIPTDMPVAPQPQKAPIPEQQVAPPPPTTGPSNKGNKPPRKKDSDSDLKSYTKSLLDQL